MNSRQCRKQKNGRNSSRNFREKFTLVELLIVIALIAILAALLLPALNSARALAVQMKCSSSMKQMALAASMYAMQNDEWNMPFQSGSSGGTRWVMNGEFVSLMQIRTPGYGYWDDRFVCPNTSSKGISGWLAGTKYALWAYGMTRWGGNCYPSGTGVVERTDPMAIYRRTKIWPPSSKFLFLEATGGAYANYYKKDPAEYWWRYHNGDGEDTPSPYEVIAYRHGKDRKVNAAFFDGHVSSLDCQDLLRSGNKADLRWNAYARPGESI